MAKTQPKCARCFEWLRYRWYMVPKPTVVLLLLIFGAVVVIRSFDSKGDTEPSLAMLAIGVGAVFSIASAHHAKVRHFLECFTRCNERYAELNECLRDRSAAKQGEEGSKEDLGKAVHRRQAPAKPAGQPKASSPGTEGVKAPASEKPDDEVCKDKIDDYFNLCAEEHLMHKMGVIPDSVWDVWRRGIHDKARQPHIKSAWDGQKAEDYYGFDLEQIMGEHHKAHAHECADRLDCEWYPMKPVVKDGEVQPCGRCAQA